MKLKMSLLISILLLLLVGCGEVDNVNSNDKENATTGTQNSQTTGEQNSQPANAAEIVITDSKGVELTFDSVPERVVVLGSYPAAMFKAMGLEERVVGIDKNTREKTQWPAYVKDVTIVGDSKTPDIEQIAALEPDLVVAVYLKTDVADKLVAAGIPVAWIYGYKTETIPTEFRLLGKLFDQEEIAEKNAEYIEDQWEKVKSRTIELADEQKPKVYWEGSSGAYKTFAKGTGADPLITMAGGINISGNEPVANPEVNAEWLVQQNPDIIIKYSGTDSLGWTGADEELLQEMKQEIINRPGFSEINAVKNDRVYIISSKITSDPMGPVGLNQVAKWFHPELFADIDPVNIHKEMLETFYGEEYQGEWVFE